MRTTGIVIAVVIVLIILARACAGGGGGSERGSTTASEPTTTQEQARKQPASKFEDILANENTEDPAIITIEPTDAGFQAKRCGTWTQDLSPITESTTSFRDGVYFVGTDIERGTYKSGGSNGCCYVRLRAFNGSFENIIANENTDAPAVVEIAKEL